MCGLAGFVDFTRPADSGVAARMAAALCHRGPDSSGSVADGAVALAHQRLAIVDLSRAGSQPMSLEDNSATLVYVGETYNAPELKRALEKQGVTFRSRSDTEVVLRAVAREHFAVRELNGMFAFALYDRRRQKVLLARDRYGIKPLYYAVLDGRVLFASEVKALLAHPGMHTALDADALAEYLTFQNFISDRTLFSGVRLLPPGCTLTISLDAEAVGTVTPYWDFDFDTADTSTSRAEQAEELERLFQQAVERQLMSDVPIGAYLSGGIDTGAITAVASKHLGPMRSFTVGFDLSSASGIELGYDERSQAERMSYLFGTEHYEVVLKAGDMERALPHLVWHLEEPRVGQSYPNYYAAKLAASFDKVVLSGAGGDELFAGYPWRYFGRAGAETFDTFAEHYFSFWQRLVPADALARLLRPFRAGVDLERPAKLFRSALGPPTDFVTTDTAVNRSLYFEAKTFLHGLLVVEDKLSMAFGLETRVPFLDNDLVDFAQRVPVAYKLKSLTEAARLDENVPGRKRDRYFSQTQNGKLILRDVLSRHVPEAVSRPKQGFSGPDASWFRGESINYIRRLLLTGTPALYEFIDRSTASELLEDHLEGRANRRLLVWSLACLEHWCQIFLLGELPHPPSQRFQNRLRRLAS